MSDTGGSAGRLARVREVMAAQELPGFLITQMDNVRWASGFTGSSGFVVLTQQAAIFATDSRYTTQARAECPGFDVRLLPTSAPDEIIAVLAGAGVPCIGFDACHLTVRLHDTYREKLPPEIELRGTERIVEDLRLVKDGEEVAAIEAACSVADRAFEHILPFLRPGAVERDVMLELEWFMRKECRAEVAFDTIVASGPRSALPHGRASERVLEAGDFVTLDYGARLGGYCSDITRTVVLGEATARQREVYAVVLEAQRRAIEAMVPGATGKDVDAIAREHIKEAGYGDYFGHGLGHSLGRAVHDGPGLSVRSDITLAPGMVLTVEPGIYIPDWGGVRVEHDVLVTDRAPRVLTQAPTELLCL